MSRGARDVTQHSLLLDIRRSLHMIGPLITPVNLDFSSHNGRCSRRDAPVADDKEEKIEMISYGTELKVDK